MTLNIIFIVLGVLILIFSLILSNVFGPGGIPFEGGICFGLGLMIIILSAEALDYNRSVPAWVFIPLAFFLFFILFIAIKGDDDSNLNKTEEVIYRISRLMILPVSIAVLVPMINVVI